MPILQPRLQPKGPFNLLCSEPLDVVQEYPINLLHRSSSTHMHFRFKCLLKGQRVVRWLPRIAEDVAFSKPDFPFIRRDNEDFPALVTQSRRYVGVRWRRMRRLLS